MRLIDADALLEKSQYFGEGTTWDNPYSDGCFAVRERDIENAPTKYLAIMDFCKPKICDYGKEQDFFCKICGNALKENTLNELPNYCCNCGCKINWDL